MGRGPLTKAFDPVPISLKKALERLAEAGVFKEFYLAGGTGLALVLAHRRSVHLALFSRRNRLDFDGRRALLSLLQPLPGWSIREVKPGTLHGQLGRIRVSFFWFDAPLLNPLIRRGQIRIASLQDIGLMKIGAIIGRGSRKDFFDLYAISRQVSLSKLLRLSSRKFRDSRDFILQALKALVYFEDADREPAHFPGEGSTTREILAGEPELRPPAGEAGTVAAHSWDEIKSFFRREVGVLAKRHLQTPLTRKVAP